MFIKLLVLLILVGFTQAAFAGETYTHEQILKSNLSRIEQALRDVIYRSRVDVSRSFSQLQACYWLGQTRTSLEASSENVAVVGRAAGNEERRNYAEKIDLIHSKTLNAIAESSESLCLGSSVATISEQDKNQLINIEKAVRIELTLVQALLEQLTPPAAQ